MLKDTKKILIVDEVGFSRICSAILQKDGFETIAVNDVQDFAASSEYRDYGLIITSYPFAEGILHTIREMDVPTIVLSDRLNGDVIRTMENLGKAFFSWMIKPLDYIKFRNLIQKIMLNNDLGMHPVIGNYVSKVQMEKSMGQVEP